MGKFNPDLADAEHDVESDLKRSYWSSFNETLMNTLYFQDYFWINLLFSDFVKKKVAVNGFKARLALQSIILNEIYSKSVFGNSSSWKKILTVFFFCFDFPKKISDIARCNIALLNLNSFKVRWRELLNHFCLRKLRSIHRWKIDSGNKWTVAMYAGNEKFPYTSS